MSYNSVEHLDSTMFEPIAGLLYLNLSHNRLTILPDNAFANLANLRELDLSDNNVRANFKVTKPNTYFYTNTKVSLNNCYKKGSFLVSSNDYLK